MSLLFQAIAVVVATAVLMLVTGLPARRSQVPGAVVLVVTVVLAVFFAMQAWESSRALGDVRGDFTGLDERAARVYCARGSETATHPGFLGWLEDHIPPRERYYLSMPTALRARTSDLCASMILLPRVRIAEPERARYLVFWEVEPEEVRAAARRPGAVLESFGPRYHLVRLP